MDPGTLVSGSGTPGTFTLTKQDSSTSVAANVAYNLTTKTAYLDPSSDLEANTTYTARVKGGSTGAKDLAGNALEQDYSWTFTTAPPPDIQAPAVKRVAPAENATGIAPGTNISAIFSEAMKASSINARTFKLFKKGSTTALAATVMYDATAKRAVLNPSANLQRGAIYKTVVTTGVRDLAGNQLGQQKVWFFTVRN